MLGYAARYGHQPILQMIGPVTLEQIAAFNEGVGHWIKAENDSGGGMTNRFATGG